MNVKQVMLDEVDAVTGNVDVSIDNVDVIFMDVSFSFEGADVLVEDQMGDRLLLLQSDQICPQFDGDEINVDSDPKEGEHDDSDKEGNDGGEGDVEGFGHQNKVVHVSLDNEEA